MNALPLAHIAQLQPAGPVPPISGSSGGDGRPSFPQLLHTVAAAAESVTLTLASFAVTKLAYVRLTKQFRDKYLEQTGIDVRFRLTFAGSGVQVRRRTHTGAYQSPQRLVYSAHSQGYRGTSHDAQSQ